MYLAMVGVEEAFGMLTMCFLLRFRRVSLIPLLGISYLYYEGFKWSARVHYKMIVDEPVCRLARELGHGKHVQPIGTFKPQGMNVNRV